MEAAATGNHERNHDPIARPKVAHTAADLFDNAHELMAQHVAAVQVGNLAAIQMQVRTADRRGGHAQNQVVGSRQHRVGDGVDTDVLAAVVGQSAHMLLQ